jgi:HEAT repeat protein
VRFGWTPDYSALDATALESHSRAIAIIAGWMGQSSKADLVTAAIGLLGRLPPDPALPMLEKHLAASDAWHRTAAIEALARIGTVEARTLIGSAAERDPDESVRAAAARQLAEKPR